jgi:ribosomal protein S18 acetylase RimI-like enzyme
MRIRPYADGDEPAVIGLWNEVFPYHEPRNEAATVIRQKLRSGCDLFLVAETENGVVGTVLGGYDGHRGWVYRLAVDPRCRSQGIGAALMDHLERVLVQRGCPKVNLQIHGGNAEVVAFYEQLGYRVEDRVSMGKVVSSPPASSR